MKFNKQEQKLKEYLSKLHCHGCYNQCSLANPGCGKSKIWIREAIEKLEKEEV